jgi:carbon storage regulator CsrA
LGDQPVVVRVLEVARDRVRLGIVAPMDVVVHREEVARRIAQEKSHVNYETTELAESH